MKWSELEALAERGGARLRMSHFPRSTYHYAELRLSGGAMLDAEARTVGAAKRALCAAVEKIRKAR